MELSPNMNLYEMNKAAVKNEKPLKPYQFKQNLQKIKDFFRTKADKYFMLLNREKYDFTLFDLDDKNEVTMARVMKDAETALLKRGKLVSIDLVNDDTALELWIMTDENAFAYYLFPYDDGVIH